MTDDTGTGLVSVYQRMLQEWSVLIRTKQLGSIASGLALFALSLVANYFAGMYASASVSNAVTDLILDHLPVVPSAPISVIFVQGAIAMWLYVGFLIVTRPNRAPFVLASVAVFTIIRSFFVTLTHLAPAVGIATFAADPIVSKLVFTGDLFFSGHTGLPFLLALLFWPHRRLRYLFLVSSIIFAITVLLGRLHYSVDVFGAYFITYTIFVLSQWLFPTYFRQMRQAI